MKRRRRTAFLIFLIVLIVALSLLRVLSNSIQQTRVEQEMETQQNIPSMSYQAVGGSLYFTDFSGSRELVIEPSALQHEQLRPQNIIEYSLAPDNSKLALFVDMGTDEYGIYVIEPNGQNPQFVGLANYISWSPDSVHVAYTSRLASESLPRLFVYDTQTQETWASEEKKEECFLNYYDFKWQDSQTVLTKFQCISEIPFGSVVEEGDLELGLHDLQKYQE